MQEQLHALQASAARLRRIVEGLAPEQLSTQAYPTKWTIADVLSHLGSGAVIMLNRIETSVSGTEAPDGFNQSVWDEWNAKAPLAKATDALAADRALLERAAALTDAEQATFHFSIGPMSFDITGALGLRLNEHALHTWDIEVVGDPKATLYADETGLIVDNLQLITRFGTKADGVERTIAVHTTEPDRDFTLATTTDSVSLEPSEPAAAADLRIPAEAFVRLTYGRLDPDHTPPGIAGVDLDPLRRIFPGI